MRAVALTLLAAVIIAALAIDCANRIVSWIF